MSDLKNAVKTALAMPSPQMMGTMGRGALMGGGIGAASGAMAAGEGNRLEGALAGGAGGAALGAAGGAGLAKMHQGAVAAGLSGFQGLVGAGEAAGAQGAHALEDAAMHGMAGPSAMPYLGDMSMMQHPDLAALQGLKMAQKTAAYRLGAHTARAQLSL